MKIILFFNIFLIGSFILITALIVNILAEIFGVSTWYTFTNKIKDKGFFGALKTENFFSLLFLFFIYPFILGATGYRATTFLMKGSENKN